MKKIIIVLLFVTFVFAVPAFSQMGDRSMKDHSRGGHEQMMDRGHVEMMGDMMARCIEQADKIGFSEDQIMKMKPLHREMQKKQARFRADLKIAEIELMEIMEVKDFDLEKAGLAVKKIAEIKTAHHLDMLKAMKDMRANLTDEQFKNMKKMMPWMMGEKKPSKRMMKKQ